MADVRNEDRRSKIRNNFRSSSKIAQQIKQQPKNNFTDKRNPTDLSTSKLTNKTGTGLTSTDNDFKSLTVDKTDLPKKKDFSSRNSLRLAQSDKPENTPTVSNESKMLNQVSHEDIEALRYHLGIESQENYVPLRDSCFTKIVGSYYYCFLCGRRERFEVLLAIEQHVESQIHVNNLLRLRSLLVNQGPQEDSLAMCALEHLLRDWYNDNSLTELDYNKRWSVIEEFESLLGQLDPDCHCRIYGSQWDGTSLRDSTINIELIHPNSNLFDSDPRAKNSIHHQLVDPSAEYGKQFNNHVIKFDLVPNASDTLYKLAVNISSGYLAVKTLTVLSSTHDLNAKVPKLLLKHEPTGLNLEVACNADTHFRTSNLLRMYLTLDNRALTLGTLVNYWTKVCNISNPEQGGTLPHDAYLILVIYFLQRTKPPVLPCVHELAAAQNKIDEWRSSDDDVLLKGLKKLSVSEGGKDKKTNGFESEHFMKQNSNIERLVREEEAEDEDVDEDALYSDIEPEFFEKLNWQSKNTDSVHKLFIDFLEFIGKELSARGTVISIRTFKTINPSQRRWNAEIKAIENPIKPQLNMSRSIGSIRTFDYIKSAFWNSWYYLTSIPLNKQLKKLTEPLSDPTDFVDMYVNLNRLEFYCKMRENTIRSRQLNSKPLDAPLEMVQQGLFGRDVAVINNLISYIIQEGFSIENLPKLVGRMYNQQMLVPSDRGAALFCWPCRRVGHSKNTCPKASVKKLDSQLDVRDIRVNLDDGFNAMFEIDKITPELSKKHQMVVADLTKLINSWTGLDCQLQLFGSTVNNLGSCDSDLDICMTLRGNQTGASVDCVSILRSIQEMLERNELCSDIEAILSARVPILKFLYLQFKIDLSMYNQCAIHNSKLLRSYVLIDNRVAKLVYLVKRYAKTCGIADASRGSLSSYAWSLMVIHFLQNITPPILPVLQEPDKSTPKQSYGVNGWDVWFQTDVKPNEKARNEVSITELFKYFLFFYSNYDFMTRVVSIRTSATVSKFRKNWNNCMMAIEDPFELTYNLSGRLDDPMAIYIMNSFYYAYKHIVKFQERCLRQRISTPSAHMIKEIFCGKDIMNSDPPNRGCRVCYRIGHRYKDCPELRRNRERRINKQINNGRNVRMT